MNITHINHASILIESNGYYILTDPWVESHAFSGWRQQPEPSIKKIEEISKISPSNLLVLCSHGHDDHFDDAAIKKYFNNNDIVIAKFKGPGVKFRAQRVTNGDVTQVDSDAFTWNGYKIKSYINADYTGDDAIFTIATESNFIVHANDNWHEQPFEIIDKIKYDSSKYPSSKKAWLSQVGIAGSFPIYYGQYSHEEKTKIIKDAIDKMLLDGLKNAKKIEAKYHYIYANQSMFINYVDYLKSYDRDIWINDSINKAQAYNTEHIEQLFPGTVLFAKNKGIASKNPSFNIKKFDSNNKELAHFSNGNIEDDELEQFSNQCNDYISSKLGQEGQFVGFYNNNSKKIISNKISDNWDKDFNILSEEGVWKKVYDGKINIECMTIGGLGTIYKKDKNKNYIDIHILISNFGYGYQARKNKPK